MKTIIIASAILITACSSTDYIYMYRMPEAPPLLNMKCKKLSLITENDKTVNDLIIILIDDTNKFNNCQILLNSWQEWYKNNKQLELNDGKM